MSQEAAVRAAKRGDAEAFAVLVRAHQQAVFRAAWLLLRDEAAAEDAAQEAFIRAFRELHRFREGEAFRPWLLRIATNLTLNDLRARGRRAAAGQRLASVSTLTAEGPAASIEEAAESARVRQAISELRPEDQQVIYLRYFLDPSERELSAAIGKPPGTVKSRLHRAGGRLRQAIEARYPNLLEASHG